MLSSQSFFFQRENCSLFLIVFLDRLYFYDVAALLFYAWQFSFSSWNPLSVPYWFHLIYTFLRSLQFSFLFAWNFLLVTFSLQPREQNLGSGAHFLFFAWKFLSYRPFCSNYSTLYRSYYAMLHLSYISVHRNRCYFPSHFFLIAWKLLSTASSLPLYFFVKSSLNS